MRAAATPFRGGSERQSREQERASVRGVLTALQRGDSEANQLAYRAVATLHDHFAGRYGHFDREKALKDATPNRRKMEVWPSAYRKLVPQ